MGLGLAEKLKAQKENTNSTLKKVNIEKSDKKNEIKNINIKPEESEKKKDKEKILNELILEEQLIKTQPIQTISNKKATSIKIKESLFDAFTKLSDSKNRSKNEIFNTFFISIIQNNLVDNNNKSFIQNNLMELKFSSELRTKVQTYYIKDSDLKMIDNVCKKYKLSRPDLLELCILSLIKKN